MSSFYEVKMDPTEPKKPAPMELAPEEKPLSKEATHSIPRPSTYFIDYVLGWHFRNSTIDVPPVVPQS